jgi:hypothetical protein
MLFCPNNLAYRKIPKLAQRTNEKDVIIFIKKKHGKREYL